MKHPLENNLDDFYEYLLLGPLITIYSAKRKTQTNTIKEFSNLLIDKFAIHSSSFFHLSKGIIELKKSNEKTKITGYDLFTVNSTFRAMMESYATFNNIFVEPKSDDETEFRFLLWKLDGLFDKQKLEIGENDFPEAKQLLEQDKRTLAETITKIDNNKFCKNLQKMELEKVYNPDKSRSNWRFLIDADFKITTLKITGLIKHTCKTRGFINTYRYASTHTHTNYVSIEHFKQTRGVPISDEYVNPIIKLAIYLTCLIISDMTIIDENAKLEFQNLPTELKEYVTGVTCAIKNQ